MLCSAAVQAVAALLVVAHPSFLAAVVAALVRVAASAAAVLVQVAAATSAAVGLLVVGKLALTQLQCAAQPEFGQTKQ